VTVRHAVTVDVRRAVVVRTLFAVVRRVAVMRTVLVLATVLVAVAVSVTVAVAVALTVALTVAVAAVVTVIVLGAGVGADMAVLAGAPSTAFLTGDGAVPPIAAAFAGRDEITEDETAGAAPHPVSSMTAMIGARIRRMERLPCEEPIPEPVPGLALRPCI
jgi:hypothetical protein